MSTPRIKRHEQRLINQPQLIITQPQLLTFEVGLVGDDSTFYFNFPASDLNLSKDELKLKCLTSLLVIIQYEPNFKDQLWQNCLSFLSKYLNQNKNLVCQLIGKLPVLAKTENFYSNNEIEEKVNEVYSGISTWLWHWANNLPTTKLRKNPKIDCYKSPAMVCKRRYELIEYLYSEPGIVNKDIFKNPEIAWLFSECSNFWICILSHMDCKNTIYKNGKRYIDYLEDLVTIENPQYIADFNNIEDCFDFTNQYFDHIARVHQKFIDDDGYYEKNLFNPYIAAKRHWNSISKSPKYQLVLVDGTKPHNKPGRRIGKKYRKY